MPLPMFNPFDPVGSWLDGLANSMVTSAASLLDSTLSWITAQAAPDFTMAPLVSSYRLSLTLAVAVLLPTILIGHFVRVASGKVGASELWDVLLVRIPRALILSAFALTIGTMVAKLSTSLSASIVSYTLGESRAAATDTFATMLPEIFLLLPGGQGVAVIMSCVLLLATITLAFSAILIKVLGVVLMIIVPFAAFADASARYRGLARKFVGLTAVWAFAMPAQLLLFGLFFQIFVNNADALTFTHAASDDTAQQKFDALTWLVVSAIAFILPALVPLGMFKMLNGVIGHGGGGEATSSASAPSSGGGATSAQQASTTTSPSSAGGTAGGANASSGSAGANGTAGTDASGAGGASGAAGASGASGASMAGASAAGGAASGGAASGAAAGGAGAGVAGTAGTAGAAAGAGAATGGVGAAVVGAGAAAQRMSQAASMRGARSAQSAAMVAAHAEGDSDD